MKKALTIIALMALGVSVAYGGVFMIEDYTEGIVPISVTGSHKLASVTFELGQPSIMIAATSAMWLKFTSNRNLKVWLTLNGDSLDMSTRHVGNGASFMKPLEPGSHTLDFMYRGTMFDTLLNPMLQVLVLYNDAPSVSETPPQPTPTESSTILSQGPSVTVPGCSEVVDVSGRKVDCEINGDRIMVNSLSSGTYFAKTNDGQTVKITKLQ